ncbi:hypothetical protein [Streptomyces sp. NPDC040750]|uniref:hypothetical protein n=1 Tax=Streptomyces sp. NPDC040750 TaxID=3154491 RepID=UPI0033C39A4B
MVAQSLLGTGVGGLGAVAGGALAGLARLPGDAAYIVAVALVHAVAAPFGDGAHLHEPLGDLLRVVRHQCPCRTEAFYEAALLHHVPCLLQGLPGVPFRVGLHLKVRGALS